MNMNRKSIWHHLISVLPILLLTQVPAIILMASLAIISVQTDVPMGHFTRDPLAVAQAPRYTGLISNIGILLWCASVSICLLGSAVLGRRPNNRELSIFLLWLGALTAVLLANDLF
jgi:hypothetical protein